jgi:hypothetical protein
MFPVWTTFSLDEFPRHRFLGVSMSRKTPRLRVALTSFTRSPAHRHEKSLIDSRSRIS